MISQSDRDRELYEQEFKRRHNLINWEKLIFGQGHDEGREQGQFIERIRILTQILGEPVPSVEELKQLSVAPLSDQATDCQRRAREQGMPV